LVTRDEIRQAVWGGRHLEFDQALNFAVRRLRKALGDDDPSRRIIETVPRRGYRLAGPVSLKRQPRWFRRSGQSHGVFPSR
jgi:DNA-binding winged helix-turn-helix (wHTH) protein